MKTIILGLMLMIANASYALEHKTCTISVGEWIHISKYSPVKKALLAAGYKPKFDQRSAEEYSIGDLALDLNMEPVVSTRIGGDGCDWFDAELVGEVKVYQLAEKWHLKTTGKDYYKTNLYDAHCNGEFVVHADSAYIQSYARAAEALEECVLKP